AAGDSKRRNPAVLPVGDIVAGGQIKNVTVDYLMAPVLMLEFDRAKATLGTLKTGGGAATGFAGPSAAVGAAGGVGEDIFARGANPSHLVVVAATFPYRDQVEVIRKAMRLSSLGEVYAAGLTPKFLAVNVMRWEIKPDGKAGEAKVLYEYDPAK